MPLFTVQFSVLPAMPGTETRTLPPETAAVSDGEDAKSLCHKVVLHNLTTGVPADSRLITT